MKIVYISNATPDRDYIEMQAESWSNKQEIVTEVAKTQALTQQDKR